MGGAGGEAVGLVAGLRWTWVVLMSRSCLRRMLAISIVMPQKSGTKWAQVAWQVKEHSEHIALACKWLLAGVCKHTGALLGVLPAQRQHVPTVTTPVGADVGDSLETMRNAVIDLFLVSLLQNYRQLHSLTPQQTCTHRVRVTLRDTLGNDLGITLLMTSIPTILTLIPLSGEQKLLTQRAEDGLVELSLDEFMTVHLEDVALALSDSALSSETSSHLVVGSLFDVFLDCTRKGQLKPPEQTACAYQSPNATPQHPPAQPQTTHQCP